MLTKVKKIKILILSLVSLVLISCSAIQVGQDFKLDTFSKNIVVGKTTKQQVQQWLGAPVSIGFSQKIGAEQLEEWAYYYASGKLTKTEDIKLKLLQVNFNKKGLVQAYNWSSGK